MAIVTLPSFDDPFHRFTTALDGTDYVFEFRYNQREQVWYFSLYLVDGTALTTGVKVVCKTHLLERYRDAALPQGVLMAIPNDGDDTPPAIGELGDDRRVSLVYFSPADVRAVFTT